MQFFITSGPDYGICSHLKIEITGLYSSKYLKHTLIREVLL